jgi:hypothetical protein
VTLPATVSQESIEEWIRAKVAEEGGNVTAIVWVMEDGRVRADVVIEMEEETK